MEPVRCHISSIFENGLKAAVQIIPALLIPLLAGGIAQAYWKVFTLAAMSVLVLTFIFQVMRWRRTWLLTRDDQLIIRSGVFWRKQLAIPFDKINTVDLSRNLIERLLGTCRLKVDTGVIIGSGKTGSEVDLVFNMNKAELIRQQILDLKSNVDSLHDDFSGYPDQDEPRTSTVQINGMTYAREGSNAEGLMDYHSDESKARQINLANGPGCPEYRARMRDFVYFGLTRKKMLSGIIIIFSLLAFIDNIVGDRAIDIISQFAVHTWRDLSNQTISRIVLIAAGLLFVYYAAANLISIVITVARFYNFRATREQDHIHIEYGLITAKSYTLPVKNIRSVVVNQNLLRQWLSLASVELVSIGYGDEKNEIALLFPLVGAGQVKQLLNHLLPEWSEEAELEPAPARALRRYLFIPGLAVLAVFTILTITVASWIGFIIAPAMLIVWYSRYLHFRHAGIGIADQFLMIRRGGFTCQHYRIPLQAVQSVQTTCNPLLRRAGLRNYRIDYHAPAMRVKIHIKFMTANHLPLIWEMLEKQDRMV